MNDFEKTIVGVDQFCSENSLEYVIIGGAAVIFHGFLRTTRDIDLTILCQLEDLESVHEKIKSKYNIVINNSLEFFSRNFVIPAADRDTNIRIDFSAGLTVFDKIVVKRKKKQFFGEANAYYCSLEDLIIYKLFAGRPQDSADVQELIEKNKNLIDKNYLFQTAEKFSDFDRKDIKKNLMKLLNE